ncbi:MAG: insulinase family protein [Bacteroidetes bacterium]|nr:insulinase family protein [Bacteroidota bacterium]
MKETIEAKAEYKNLSYTEPKDNFDRSKVPAAKVAKLVPLPNYWTSNFNNGDKAIGINNNDIPKVNIQFTMPIGHRYEPKSGLAVLLTSLMEESKKKHSAEEIGNILERLGSEVSFYANDNEVGLYISALKQNLDSTLKIAEEMLFMPKFDQEDFESVKKRTVRWYY